MYKDINQVNLKHYEFACVITPPQFHFQYTMKLLAASVPVFVEKPVTLNHSDTKQLISCARANNTYLQFGYVYRFHPVLKEFKRQISSYATKLLNLKLDLQANVNTSSSGKTWRNNDEKGAGVIYDFGSHMFDIAIFLTQENKPLIKHKMTEKSSLLSRNCVDKFSSIFSFDDIEVEVSCNWSMRQ